MRTIKQIKARKRNFTIMYLTGVLTEKLCIKRCFKQYTNQHRVLTKKKQIMKIPFMVKLKKM